MAVDWNAHRFSGGLLALDLVNTIIYREDPPRSQDRFSDRSEIARFGGAAEHFRADEWGAVHFLPPASGREGVIVLREAINALFRDIGNGTGMKAENLSRFLECGSQVTGAMPLGTGFLLPDGRGAAGPLPLDAAAFLSALRLLDPERLDRLKVCPNCHWLYLDASRNRSRRWCDMNVCGNRAKAKRHYHRHQGGKGENIDA